MSDRKIVPLNGGQVTKAFEFASQKMGRANPLSTREGWTKYSRSFRERNAVFARVTHAEYSSEIMESVKKVLSGGNRAEEMARLQGKLKELGYTHHGGFKGHEHHGVPSARKGTLRDLSSNKRIMLQLNTEVALAYAKAQELRGMTADQLYLAPCWEMVREHNPRQPRDWPSRWAKAGGPPPINGRFIAAKQHPVWHTLGSHALFTDGLDTTSGPYWFGSTGVLNAVLRQECVDLGVMKSNGSWENGYGPAANPPPVSVELPPPEVNDKTWAAPIKEAFAAWYNKAKQAAGWFASLFGGKAA